MDPLRWSLNLILTLILEPDSDTMSLTILLA